jgi:capsid portal protein
VDCVEISYILKDVVNCVESSCVLRDVVDCVESCVLRMLWIVWRVLVS